MLALSLWATPTLGYSPSDLRIAQQKITGATNIVFGGITATSFTVNSDSMVTVFVPAGAKSGKITLTTAGGTATSASSFTVLP